MIEKYDYYLDYRVVTLGFFYVLLMYNKIDCMYDYLIILYLTFLLFNIYS